MIGYFRNLFDNRKPATKKGAPLVREPAPPIKRPVESPADKIPTFSKVFRYRLPDGQTEEPASVEVVGSFSKWKKVPLMRDGKLDAWHVTVHHIPGNRTHHYMLLVDGAPFYDHTCDGLAIPHGPLEEQYQLATDKGPRVLMLFAQTR